MINSIKVSLNGHFVGIRFDENDNQKVIEGYEFTRCWHENGTEEIKILDTETGIYDRFVIVSNGAPEDINRNMIFTNINNCDIIEITEVRITVSGASYVWSKGSWNFVNPLKIVGIQHLPIAEFTSFEIINFPTDLQGFFMAVSSGSFKFERKDGEYILTLSN